jgi:hypothetical protein
LLALALAADLDKLSGMSRTITLHTLQYTKADLAAAPEADRTFFLMTAGLMNEYQMLYKMLTVVIDTDPVDSHIVINQGNSALGMLILRMFAGRLCEGWKVVQQFSKRLKEIYEPDMEEEEREAIRQIRAYFNPRST